MGWVKVWRGFLAKGHRKVTVIDKKKEDAYRKVICDIDLTVVALSLKSESNNKRLLT
jgi:hypothetical protein